MDGNASQFFEELDPARKDTKWANQSVTSIRSSWKPYFDFKKMELNKSYLYSAQAMDKIKAQYKDKAFLENTEFRPLGIVEAIRNTLIEELTKEPPRAEIKATDPAALSDKQKDLGLLQNRKYLLGPVAKYNRQVGLPPQQLDYGKFKSNVEDFDKAGFDENDPDDVNFFADKMQKLDYESSLQSVINNIMKLNRFDESTARRFVDDILASRRISMQSYVDKLTGEIKYKYLHVESCRGIFGASDDGWDDVAKGWEDAVTVSEFLQMAGNDFDFQRDWKMLLNSVNFQSGKKITGFDLGGGIVLSMWGEPGCTKQDGFLEQQLTTWGDCLRYYVYVGYVEWRSNEATGTYVKDSENENNVRSVPYSYQLGDHEPITKYYKESYFQQQMYGTFYLSTSGLSQMVFNFSKVYYQQLYGSNHQYALGTLIFLREPGKPPIELVMTDIDLANKVYFKMLFLIDKAKPKKDVFVWEELLQQAKIYMQMYPDQKGSKAITPGGIIKDIMKASQENSVEIRAYPQIDGKTVQQLPSLEGGGSAGGLDATATVMQAITQWAESLVARRWGVNGMRFGGNPPSRESQASEMASVDASRNATGFIYRMIQFMKERIATTTLAYAQDISKYKDSLPYKYLEGLVGSSKWNAVQTMNEFAAHTMGMFVRDYNIEIERQDMKRAAYIALQEKSISYAEFILVTQTEDPKDANLELAKLQYKNDKKMRKRQMEDRAMQSQLQQQANDLKMGQLKYERETLFGVAGIKGDATKYSADSAANSRVQVKQLSVDSEPAKQDAKASAQQNLEYVKSNIKESQPFQAD